PEERRRSLEDLVGPLELPVLLLQLLDPLGLRGRYAWRVALVDIGLLDPLAHRLHAVSQLGRDPLDRPVLGPQLCTPRADHPDRSSLVLRGVAPRLRLPGHPLLRHVLILVSQGTSLHRTQCGSEGSR